MKARSSLRPSYAKHGASPGHPWTHTPKDWRLLLSGCLVPTQERRGPQVYVSHNIKIQDTTEVTRGQLTLLYSNLLRLALKAYDDAKAVDARAEIAQTKYKLAQVLKDADQHANSDWQELKMEAQILRQELVGKHPEDDDMRSLMKNLLYISTGKTWRTACRLTKNVLFYQAL